MTKKQNKRNIYAIDLFCGAGGLTHGLQKAGINVKLGIDIDPNCEYPYTANNSAQFLLKSVDELSSSDLVQHYRKNGLKLLAGCAPCQTFSTYNQKSSESDKRWWLLLQFSRLVTELQPDFVTMENVPGLMSQNVFQEFVTNLKSQKYSVSYQIVDCSQYGIPQHRNRLVLLASKHGQIELLSPEQLNIKKRTVKQAIGDLSKLDSGEQNSEDPLHQCASLSNLNLKRIKASKPGGTWRDWPDELIADCHKKKSGKTYPGVYGRMMWDDPAPTITTQFFGFGNGRFGHPEQDRALSLREGAILQSFPKKYKFVPSGKKIAQTTIGRLIGNAVPVRLGEVIGKSILEHINNIK